MRDTIAWVLGVAAIAAALRGAWLHHMDNQLVIRTDWQRDGFIAGQAAERARAKAEADAERQAAYFGPVPVPDQAWADLGYPAAWAKWPEDLGDFYEGPIGDQAIVVEPVDPEIPGWIERGGPGQGSSG